MSDWREKWGVGAPSDARLKADATPRTKYWFRVTVTGTGGPATGTRLCTTTREGPGFVFEAFTEDGWKSYWVVLEGTTTPPGPGREHTVVVSE